MRLYTKRFFIEKRHDCNTETLLCVVVLDRHTLSVQDMLFSLLYMNELRSEILQAAVVKKFTEKNVLGYDLGKRSSKPVLECGRITSIASLLTGTYF